MPCCHLLPTSFLPASRKPNAPCFKPLSGFTNHKDTQTFGWRLVRHSKNSKLAPLSVIFQRHTLQSSHGEQLGFFLNVYPCCSLYWSKSLLSGKLLLQDPFQVSISSSEKLPLTYSGRVNDILVVSLSDLAASFIIAFIILHCNCVSRLFSLWACEFPCQITYDQCSIFFFKQMNEWQSNVCVTLIFGYNAQPG